MIKKFCRWYLESTIEKEIQNKVDEQISKMLDWEKEEFKINDVVYFYYTKGEPYIAHGTYYKAIIMGIETKINEEGLNVKYNLKVLHANFSSNFSVNEDDISHSMIGLREKILSMNTFYPITNKSYKKVNLDD